MKFTSFAIAMLLAESSASESHRVQLSKSKYSKKDKIALGKDIPKLRAAGAKHVSNQDSKVISGNGDSSSSWFGTPIKPIWERIKKSGGGKVQKGSGDKKLWDNALKHFQKIEDYDAQ